MAFNEEDSQVDAGTPTLPVKQPSKRTSRECLAEMRSKPLDLQSVIASNDVA
jgi:hypothetical protein